MWVRYILAMRNMLVLKTWSDVGSFMKTSSVSSCSDVRCVFSVFSFFFVAVTGRVTDDLQYMRLCLLSVSDSAFGFNGTEASDFTRRFRTVPCSEKEIIFKYYYTLDPNFSHFNSYYSIWLSPGKSPLPSRVVSSPVKGKLSPFSYWAKTLTS